MLWLLIVLGGLLLLLSLPIGVDVLVTEHQRHVRLFWAGLSMPGDLRHTGRAIQPDVSRILHAAKRLRSLNLGALPRLLFMDMPWLGRVLVRFRKVVKVRIRRCKITVATPDPALTGMVYGAICAGMPLLPRRWCVMINADFDSDRPALDLRAVISAIPARMLGILVFSVTEYTVMRLRQRSRPLSVI